MDFLTSYINSQVLHLAANPPSTNSKSIPLAARQANQTKHQDFVLLIIVKRIFMPTMFSLIAANPMTNVSSRASYLRIINQTITPYSVPSRRCKHLLLPPFFAVIWIHQQSRVVHRIARAQITRRICVDSWGARSRSGVISGTHVLGFFLQGVRGEVGLSQYLNTN